MPTVSICIPTYKRPDLLKVALDSCLSQTFQDFEIIIVDDSPDLETEKMFGSISAKQPVRYIHNPRRTGQASSINQLFKLAEGEFLTLLHDDNFLMPTALELMIKPLQENPALVAAFGMEYLVTHEGIVLEHETLMMNKKYSRTKERANRVQQSDWSALVQQFPGDGYLIRSAAARSTLYRADPEVGEACDTEFGYRLAKAGEFFFVGEFTSAYRTTKESLSTIGMRECISKLYGILENLPVASDLENIRRAKLKELASVAVTGSLLLAARGRALKILLSHNYPWKREFIKGTIQLGLVFAPRTLSTAIARRR